MKTFSTSFYKNNVVTGGVIRTAGIENRMSFIKFMVMMNLIVITLLFLQIEPADALYSRNIIPNNDFEKLQADKLKPTNWLLNNVDPKQDTTSFRYKRFGDRSMHLAGSPNLRKSVYQRINLAGKASDTFRLSGWIKTSGPINNNGYVALDIGIHYTDGSWDWKAINTRNGAHSFEMSQVELQTTKPYDYLFVHGLFYNQPVGSHVWFDGLRLDRNPHFEKLLYRVSVKDLDDGDLEDLNASMLIEPYLDSRTDDAIDLWLKRVPSNHKVMFPMSSKGQGYSSDATYYMWLKGTDGKFKFNYRRAQELIDAYDSNSQISHWYLYDEPILGTVTNAELTAAYKFVKSKSKKPIAVAYSEGRDFAGLGYGNSHSDLILFSFYPYGRGQAVDLSDTRDHCKIERDWRAMSSGIGSTKPWYGVVQAFGKEGTAYSEPSNDQIRTQVNEYVSLGASGVAYFSTSRDSSDSSYYHILDLSGWTETVSNINLGL